MNVHTLDHPLAQHLLSELRDKSTNPDRYRTLTKTLTTLLLAEAASHFPTRGRTLQTPLETFEGKALAHGLAAVPVLRAGLGMLEAVVSLFPDVAVGYIGLERDEETAKAHSYYCKLPEMADRIALCLDPMLATGGSASQALALIEQAKPVKTVLVSIVSAPEGIETVRQNHPMTTIVTAAIDRGLDEKKYIVPGLGDFGDRLYGTL